jgi:DNA polymerase-3 subunit beta
MKITLDRDKTFEILQKLQSVVEKKNTVQILSNILCVAEKGKLSLSATDLEVGIKVSLPAKIEQEGKITLSAKNFFDIVKELPSQPFQLSTKSNDWVEILSGKSKFSIVSLSAEDYPSLPSFEERTYFEANTEKLSDMIDRTAFAVSTDATRYNLNGVYFEPIENQLMRMTATDGHRLSFIDQEVFLKMPELKRGMIIPKKGLSELKKFLDDSPASLQLAFDRGYLFAKTTTKVTQEENSLFIRLIESEYPDYKQVIPKVSDKSAKIARDPFIAALRRVSLLAHEKSRGVKFIFSPNMLTISSSNPDMGEAREEIDVEYQGETVDIGFNAKYLLDCLPVIDSDQIEFRFKDRLNPGIVHGLDQKNHTYIVMPMRI